MASGTEAKERPRSWPQSSQSSSHVENGTPHRPRLASHGAQDPGYRHASGFIRMVHHHTPRDQFFIRTQRRSRHASYLQDEDLALKCPQCGRGYKVRHSLSKHLKYECGGRRHFCCDRCDRSFTQNVSLRRHLMHNHNIYRPPRK